MGFDPRDEHRILVTEDTIIDREYGQSGCLDSGDKIAIERASSRPSSATIIVGFWVLRKVGKKIVETRWTGFRDTRGRWRKSKLYVWFRAFCAALSRRRAAEDGTKSRRAYAA